MRERKNGVSVGFGGGRRRKRGFGWRGRQTSLITYAVITYALPTYAVISDAVMQL